MAKSSNLKVYFPNLNGLRFIAACFVIINHVEQLKRFYKIDEDAVSQFAKNIGKLGVMLFFVLSGFLITYLLLSEEKVLAKIHIKRFYIRRLLRIVPLYALLIIIVFFLLNNFKYWEIPYVKNPIDQNFSVILLLHIFFLPNLVTAIYGFIPYIAQAWSIGTEEQSYILWPILLKIFKKKRLFLMAGIIFFHLIIRIILSLNFPLSIPYREELSKFWNHFNIDAIAVGGFFAVLLFRKHPVLKLLKNLKVFYGVLITTLVLILMAVKIPYFHYLTYSFLFGVLILNLASNKRLNKVLESKIIHYLGQISYGIYMYHFIIMIIVLTTSSKLGVKSNVVIYSFILAITIGISSLSYHYFEAPFLKRKSKYTLIKSGGNKF